MGKMRWKSKDEIELKKKVKNFNSKIDRLRKKGYNEELLPEKKNYKELRSKVDDRRIFKAEMQIMSALTKKGSEEIIKTKRSAMIPKFAKEEIRVKLREINYERMKIRHELEKGQMTHLGEKAGSVEQNINALNINQVKKRKFRYKNMSQKEYEKFRNILSDYSVSREDKNERYRKNFYTALENTLTASEYERLKGVLDNIETEDLIKKYYTDTSLHIDFIYEPQERESIFKMQLEGWNKVLEDRITDTFNED